MLERVTGWLYERLGRRYWLVLAAGQAGASAFVAVLTIAVVAAYYGASFTDMATLAAIAAGLTLLAVLGAVWRGRPVYDAVVGWRTRPDPTTGATVEAWQAATTLTLRQFRRDSAWVNLLVVVPTMLLALPLLDTTWADLPVLLLAAVAPAAYATFLSYSVGETLSRPIVTEIAAALPDDFDFRQEGLPIDTRVRIGLPVYTVVCGMLVAAVVGERQGSSSLLVAVLVAFAVGVALSFELAHLLSRAITEPVEAVRRAMHEVRSGDLTALVPVLTSDELGELAHDFNQMAGGLQEREEMRTAFGTYVDKVVVELILSGQFPREGVQVDVSILFCDVRGFTAYAETAAPTEVVSALNRLFEITVPVIDRLGGHVDKFIGDGLLAVFGAPEPFVDHADRAVRAACEIVTAVRAADLGLTVAAGVNSGLVVAGSVGGAGRLNFSVIGDAVNVAARVEAATRETGDDVLVTAETRSRMDRVDGLVSRGTIPLKGKSQPVELFAPRVEERVSEPGVVPGAGGHR